MKKALVLDDDVICRFILTEILVEKHFTVKCFSSPACFLASKDREHCSMEVPCYDVILTDNQMPGMTGLEFLELLCQKGCKVPNQRKAIISGTWEQEDIERARQLGCQVLYKPYTFEYIQNWLEENQDQEVCLK